jgi:taurine--2-oxoglutarate transaminase
VSYYFTWTKQSDACQIPIDRCDDHHFYSGTKSYLDLSSISYQAAFGLNQQIIKEAIRKQLDHMPIASPKHVFDLKTRVSIDLLAKLGLKGKIFYTVSGAESVENALKLARQIRKAKKVLVRKNCYHGATLGAMSITGDWRHDDHDTVDEWTVRIPDHLEDPNCHLLKKIINNEDPQTIAAFCLETIVGGNGVYQAPKSWYQEVQKLCDQHNIMLILDEVICGFGRTGTYFGFQHYPFLKPDFICLSKAITGGYVPFGALYTSEKVASYYQHKRLSAGLTNYAHPLGLAALDGVMKILNDDHFWTHLKGLTDLLKKFALSLSAHVKETRQCGVLMAIDLKKGLSMQQLLNEGLYLIVQQDLQRVILAPALNIPHHQLEEGLQKLERIIHVQ